MMTQHDAFTQGFQDATRAHYGVESDVLSELDAINQRAKEYERNKRSAVTPYHEPPPLQAQYITRPTNQDVVEYATPGEAAAEFVDGVFGLVVYYAKPATAIAIVGGMGWLVVSFIQGLAVGVAAFGAGLGSVGAGAFAVVVVLALLSGLKGDGERKDPPAQSNGGTAQNINVVVNVAGNNVTTTTNGK